MRRRGWERFAQSDSAPNGRAAPRPMARVALTPEQRAAKWGDFDRLASVHETTLEAAALRLFKADAGAVARLFAQVRAASDPVLTSQEIEWALRELGRIFGADGTSTRAWSAAMREPIEAVVKAGADHVGFALPLPPNPRVAGMVAQRTDRLAALVGRTTATQVEAAILASHDAGWGVQRTADAINETVFGGLARQRATVIARTETIGALNESAYVAAQEAGQVAEVEWLTQQDDRVRDTHENQDGWRVPLGSSFPNGCRFPGDPTAPPEEIIQCRCTLLYH